MWNKHPELIALRNLYWKTVHDKEDVGNFGFTFAWCSRKYGHIAIICRRLDSLISLSHEALKSLGDSPEFRYPAVPFDEIELEEENLYLHLRILLDAFTNLIPLFYEKKTRNEIPTKSFNKQRNFFMKNTCPVNDGYAKYIRERTDWFKPLLKDPRDDYIVHKSKASSISMGTGEPPKITLYGFLRESDRKRVEELLEKHSLKQESEPLKMGTPLDEALTSLEKICGKLTKEEQNFVKRIRQDAGGSLLAIGEILQHVTDYIDFICAYFSSQLNKINETKGTSKDY